MFERYFWPIVVHKETFAIPILPWGRLFPGFCFKSVKGCSFIIPAVLGSRRLSNGFFLASVGPPLLQSFFFLVSSFVAAPGWHLDKEVQPLFPAPIGSPTLFVTWLYRMWTLEPTGSGAVPVFDMYIPWMNLWRFAFFYYRPVAPASFSSFFWSFLFPVHLEIFIMCAIASPATRSQYYLNGFNLHWSIPLPNVGARFVSMSLPWSRRPHRIWICRFELDLWTELDLWIWMRGLPQWCSGHQPPSGTIWSMLDFCLGHTLANCCYWLGFIIFFC